MTADVDTKAGQTGEYKEMILTLQQSQFLDNPSYMNLNIFHLFKSSGV